MTINNMVVFNDELQTATVERLTQMSNAFNAASGGTIILSNADNMGDFKSESFFNNLGSAMRDVDRYAANGAASNTDLVQSVIDTVKAAKAFGPILWEPSQLEWINQDQGAALSVISTSLAQAMLEAQLNRAIGASVAAISNVVTLTNDVSASAGVTQFGLNNTHALFGDRSQEILSQVMTGAVYHGLIGNALVNSAQLFSEGSVLVVDILGKITVVTDSPDLYVAGAPNKSHVLCLTAGAVTIEPNNDFTSNIHTTNGKERIETTYQSEWTENVGVKGYTWDTTNGGKSPITAELNTGSNWDQVLADKNTAGVILIADADQ